MTRVRIPGRPVIAGLALALALVLAGCAAPQYTYVADTTAHAYFKVPRVWTKISTAALDKVTGAGTPGGAWTAGYDASRPASPNHVLSLVPARPFVYAAVGQVTRAAANTLSYNLLRDSFLPVTAAARQTATQNGFPLTAFRLLGSSMLELAQGIHGIRETYDYTYKGGRVVTFDQIALTNADDTEVYVLLVHCLSACYSRHQAQINTVLKSFTVRSP